MSEEVQNSISPKQLFQQYDWFEKTFPDIVQQSWDDFFDKIFSLKLLGISKNINCLFTTESCFVTKVNMEKDYEIFFRLTDGAVDALLTATLGKGKGKFKLNSVTELETRVVTTFNSFIFGKLKELLAQPDPSELRRTNFDVYHLTFAIKTIGEDLNKAGKFIITIPANLIKPEEVSLGQDTFKTEDFPDSLIDVKVCVGKTKFKVYDLKHLEEEDIVVFEQSSISQLKVITKLNDVMTCNISPNTDIILPDEDDDEIGGDAMSGAQNLWDSIEVEMVGEFDSVKISLGDLKSISNGLVVDLASLYDNTVTLKVEGKAIAKGSLVIVNDRYGVKITEIMAEKGAGVSNNNAGDNSGGENYSQDGGNSGGGEEDFDYSDFDLDDEGI